MITIRVCEFDKNGNPTIVEKQVPDDYFGATEEEEIKEDGKSI